MKFDTERRLCGTKFGIVTLDLGRESWSMCFSCIGLFILYALISVIFSSAWCQGLDVVCDCGTPWTFLLNVLHFFLDKHVS